MKLKEIVKSVKFVPGYDSLLEVLMEAYQRASSGKGHQRHVRANESFKEQWILRGSRTFGEGSLNYQIGKKNEEIVGMEEADRKVNELLDIIVYAAAEIILLREKEEMKKS